MNQEEVFERLKKVILAHPELSKNGFIKAFDKANNKIVISKDGSDKLVTIDELEQLIANPNQPSKATREEPVEIMEEEEVETLDEAPKIRNITTLKDMNDAIIAKDEQSINKALESFAINEKTGSIDVTKAIRIVTDNGTNNVIRCVRDGYILPGELQSYDVKGNMIKEPQKGIETMQNLIDKSFNNILVYVEAAKLKNIVYNEAQIMAAKNKYTTSINDKINVLGLNKKEEAKEEVKSDTKSLAYELRPDKNLKKAGFADIFILTIIVLIYAAIVVNLISKIK